ncbi:MAG TPA: polymer-forming cytoskeletal protein [Bryobacteraceae bacterium]|nr:polymer-forming cytoskeletal protein [Bryobacteraceae bacterium]
MWNRRKDEELSPGDLPEKPAPSNFPKEDIPMSTLPSRTNEPYSDPTRTAVIGKSVVIKGQIFSREDLTIDGEIEGAVELQEHRLTIGASGKVQASIKARELIVLGSLQGNVEITDKIDIRKDARMVGDIKTARIVIEDGAYFKGNIDIVRADAKNSGASKPAAAASASSGPTLVTGTGEVKR